MEKIWNFLSGNKTIFGLVILQIATWMPEGSMLWFIPLKEALMWLGGLLTGTGVIHKLAKSDTSPNPNL